MLRGMKGIFGFALEASDGEIGKVRDYYFDDLHWRVRYMVADTGRWLPGRQVLISPQSLGKPGWGEKHFPVALTKSQIQNSPGIDTHRPVSRQEEQELVKYYNWSAYWMPGLRGEAVQPGGALLGAEAVPAYKKRTAATLEKERSDAHLRSAREIMGYAIAATDGHIGHVEDFIVDDGSWRVKYMVIDTKNWLPGRKVLVAPLWTRQFDWAGAQVVVDLNKDDIQRSPEFNFADPVSPAYEKELFDYYAHRRD
jgi:hypothetical protein